MERISRRAFLGKTVRVGIGAGLIFHGVRLTQDEGTPNYICDATQQLYDTAPEEAQQLYDQTTQSLLGKDFVPAYCDVAAKAEITTGVTFGTGIGIFRMMGFVGHSIARYLNAQQNRTETTADKYHHGQNELMFPDEESEHPED